MALNDGWGANEKDTRLGGPRTSVRSIVDPRLDEGMGEGNEARVRGENARRPGCVPADGRKFSKTVSTVINSGNHRKKFACGKVSLCNPARREAVVAYQCRTPNRCSRTITTMGTPSSHRRASRPMGVLVDAAYSKPERCIGTIAQVGAQQPENDAAALRRQLDHVENVHQDDDADRHADEPQEYTAHCLNSVSLLAK